MRWSGSPHRFPGSVCDGRFIGGGAFVDATGKEYGKESPFIQTWCIDTVTGEVVTIVSDESGRVVFDGDDIKTEAHHLPAPLRLFTREGVELTELNGGGR